MTSKSGGRKAKDRIRGKKVRVLVNLVQCDHTNRMISLTMIPLSGTHCIMILFSCAVNPVLTATSKLRPPVNNGQPKSGQATFNTNFDWKTCQDRPTLYNGHFFGVPRVAVVDRFDCMPKFSDWMRYWALLYYSGFVILADFEVIPIQTYLNLTDLGSPHLMTSSLIPPNIWPLTASIGIISNKFVS